MRILIACAFFWVVSVASAQELTLILNVEQTEMPVGIPIIIHVTIRSDKAFTLRDQFGFCGEHTGLIVLDERGNAASPIREMGCAVLEDTPFDSTAKIEYKNSASTDDEFFLNPGTYKIIATYSSIGPYLDRYSETDQRTVEGIWIGKLTSNEVKVTVKNPEGEDLKAFLDHRLSEKEISEVGAELPWFLKIKGQQIVHEYPKSNYAAWVLWKNGESSYLSYFYNDTLSVEEEFNFPLQLQEVGMTVREFRWSTVTGILEPWEQLSKDFPSFYKRPLILKALAQVHIRIGERQKAISIIKELLDKYPNTDEAKKVVAYKTWMQQKNIWK